MKKRTFPRAVAYAGCALIALTTAALAQTSDPTVEVRHDPKDSKAVPLTQEKEPVVQFLLEAGYTTQYNFRGTNLMPNADGGFFYQAMATVPKVGPGNLTFGLWAIHQMGDAVAPAWSISEGGGGAGTTLLTGIPIFDPAGNFLGFASADRFPRTTQTKFREFDLIASYKFSLGPVDITLGNILFIIDREAQTFELDVLPITNPQIVWSNPPTFTRFATFGPEATVTGEQFDRIYIRLSTAKIPHITPSIVYYQTIYNEGTQPTDPLITVLDEFGNQITNFPGPVGERNEELGGYLEGRINGNFACGPWLDINPYGVIAYSFEDRTEPVAGTFGGRPFTGWNHAQAGLELAFHITDHIDLVTNVAYSHHISEPPIGTDKNEFWGGVKVAVNLW